MRWSPSCTSSSVLLSSHGSPATPPSLRHVEYYRGILFLTTNRITAFDEAFLSRIHVALHFQELTPAARKQVWSAFLRKVGAAFPEEVVDALAARALVEQEMLARHSFKWDIQMGFHAVPSLEYVPLQLKHLQCVPFQLFLSIPFLHPFLVY